MQCCCFPYHGFELESPGTNLYRMLSFSHIPHPVATSVTYLRPCRSVHCVAILLIQCGCLQTCITGLSRNHWFQLLPMTCTNRRLQGLDAHHEHCGDHPRTHIVKQLCNMKSPLQPNLPENRCSGTCRLICQGMQRCAKHMCSASSTYCIVLSSLTDTYVVCHLSKDLIAQQGLSTWQDVVSPRLRHSCTLLSSLVVGKSARCMLSWLQEA